MRNAISMAMTCGLAMLAQVSGLHAQRQAAAPVTDANDPKFISAQTRKQGGVTPAEQLSLVFDHLDHALKVFPAEKRMRI